MFNCALNLIFILFTILRYICFFGTKPRKLREKMLFIKYEKNNINKLCKREKQEHYNNNKNYIKI